MNPSKLVLRPLPALLLGALVGQLGLAHAQQASTAASAASSAASSATPAATPSATARPAATPATQATPAVTGKPADEVKKPEEQQPGVTEMQTVTVVAERPAEQIDRSVYDVKSDAVTPSASAADVIANVPNVTVDQDGKVAVRGNQNTQIFVNGKRSAMFSGENAGDALNGYPADALESIEVITTPGAEFGSEGGGGPILNLVTRRVRPAGGQGSLTGSVGPDGRYNTFMRGSYNSGRMQVDGNLGVIRNVNERTGWTDSELQTGSDTRTTRRDLVSNSPSRSIMFAPSISYNIGETDRFSAALNVNQRESTPDSNESYRTRRADGSIYEDYRRNRNSDNESSQYQLTLNYERKFSRDEILSFDLRSSGNKQDNDSWNRNAYVVAPPSGARLESTNGNDSQNRVTDFSIDYRDRVNPRFNYRAGMKIGVNNGSSDADYFNIDPLTGEEIVDDDRASAFKTSERSYALYFSPNIRLSDNWIAMPGVRYERIDRDIDYVNQGNSASDSSRKFLPSMHLQYGWGERGATVTGAYSRRINRPGRDDINPNLQYQDEQNFSQGDPRLTPTNTDKFDLKYSDTWDWLNTNVTLYREKASPLLGRFLTPVPGTSAVISQAVNYGENTTDGFSVNLQGKPTRTLSIGATVNLRNISQSYLARLVNGDGAYYSVESERKVNSKNLQTRLQYSGIPGHTFQVNGNYTGRELRGLAEYDPSWQVMLAWTWNVAPRITLRTMLRDAFDSNDRKITEISDTVRTVSYSKQEGRILMVGLTYQFGGVTGDARLRNNPGMFRGPQGDGPRGPGPGGFGPGM